MGMGMGLIGSRSTLIEEASYYFLLSHSIIVVPIIVVQEEVLDWAELYHSAYQNGLVEIYSGNEERIKGGPARNGLKDYFILYLFGEIEVSLVGPSNQNYFIRPHGVFLIGLDTVPTEMIPFHSLHSTSNTGQDAYSITD
ncbi:hypothetical protein ACJX0J_001093 (mitochondrion) [Zea mays]